MADWPYSTGAWRVLRKRKLQVEPLCQACSRRGLVTPASHVDHVLSIKQGGEPFPPLAGLMSLCPSCHSIKTNAKDRAGGKGVAFKGCDADGVPLDPEHPFVAEGYTPSQDGEPSRRGPAGTSQTHLVRDFSRWG